MDKEAVTLSSVVCMTGWCDACPLGWCGWCLVNGVEGVLHFEKVFMIASGASNFFAKGGSCVQTKTKLPHEKKLRTECFDL
jgi:hypothetical protein